MPKQKKEIKQYKETPAIRKERVHNQKGLYTRIVPDKKKTYRRHAKHQKKEWGNNNDFYKRIFWMVGAQQSP